MTSSPIDTSATQVLRRAPSDVTVGPTGVNPTGPPWLQLPLFASMSQRAAEHLRAAMQPVHYVAGDVLMRQGEAGDHMLVLEQGCVRVEIRDEAGVVAFERELEPPALIGEMALVTAEPRTATVTAVTAVNGLRMDKPALEELCVKYPKVAVFLTRLVGDRLLETRGIRKVGKYQVVGRLGSGGVATVFEALHPALGRSVALKMLSHSLVFDPSFAKHFAREGRLVAQLEHDNIVRVLDSEQAYGTHFIVMEKLTGDLFEDIIKRGERLEWGQIRRVLIDLLRALQYSHEQGLVHRDVKPSNVFMTGDKRVKLLDFGIAIEVAASADGDDGKIIGTPYYMAPEQISGQQLDARCDVYALGILTYELCTLHLPYTGATAEEVLQGHLTGTVPDPRLLEPATPEDIAEFVQVATARNPSDRYTSCREAAEYLMRFVEVDFPDPYELSTLTTSYLPNRRAQVHQILKEASDRLRRLRGVTVFSASQQEAESRWELVRALGAKP